MWAGLRKKEVNSVSSASLERPLGSSLLHLGHMTDSITMAHRYPQAASYTEVGIRPPPRPLIPRLCGFHFFIYLFKFPIAQTAQLRFSEPAQKTESLMSKTSLACNFPFLSFVLIKSKRRRIFLYNQKLFLSGKLYFNRTFLFSY